MYSMTTAASEPATAARIQARQTAQAGRGTREAGSGRTRLQLNDAGLILSGAVPALPALPAASLPGRPERGPTARGLA